MESLGHLAPSPMNRAILTNMNALEWLLLDCKELEMTPGVCCINYRRMAPYLEPKWLL